MRSPSPSPKSAAKRAAEHVRTQAGQVPANRNTADPATVEAWLEARTERSIRAVGWTPEPDLHADYTAWASAEEHPREVVLCAELFTEALDFSHVDRQRRLVQRGEAKPAYEPCRALKLLQPIRAAA